MKNRDNPKLTARIERHIEVFTKQIKDSLEEVKHWKKILDEDIKVPRTVSVEDNNTFVHQHKVCDYCFEIFDWGKEEKHFFDRDGHDVCRDCAMNRTAN